MEHKFRIMSRHFEKYGCHVNSDKSARELLICAELLKRIRGDSEEDIPLKLHEMRMKGWLKMLGKMFERKLQTWWD